MISNKVLAISILIAVAVGVVVCVFVLAGRAGEPQPATNTTLEHFASPDLGVAFDYPNTYTLEQRKDGFEGKEMQVITLIPKGVKVPDMSEGPTAISLIAVKKFAPPTNLREWVSAKSISNFYLSPDKKLSTTTVAKGTDAVSYTYSGLYENDAIAAVRGDTMFLFFVSWISADQAIRADFDKIIQSATFE
jgi:hypothetical protein